MISKISDKRLRDSRFLLHSSPLPDELLSSWLVRVAHEHNTDPAAFVNLYMPRWRDILWTRDVDQYADRELLQTLSFKSGFSYETLFCLTLKSYDSYLVEALTQKSRNFFIQPLGNHSRVKIKYGLRYCPLCLREDKAPYFRKKWRLSFSTACIEHKCFLYDRCPKCGTSVTVQREHYLKPFPNCSKCGFIFRNAVPEFFSPLSFGLEAIRWLYEILDSGVFVFKGRNGESRYTYSFLFFNVLRQLLKIVRCKRLDKTFLDNEELTKGIDMTDTRKGPGFLEEVPLKEQYLLFSGAMKVFEDFPESLIAFCEANGLGKTELTKDMKYIPFWYCHIAELFDHENRYVGIEEVKSVIGYLRRRGKNVNLTEISKVLGVCLEYRKRRDIKVLLKIG